MAGSIVTIDGVNFKPVNYITITENAYTQVLELYNSKKNTEKDVIGILITLKQRGCAGLAYKIEYAKIGVNLFDKFELIQKPDFNLFINPKIALYLIGTQMDFKNDRLESGFVFVNPNSKGECGCGESFFV
jgi:iron-sulfur cluster assembly protein